MRGVRRGMGVLAAGYMLTGGWLALAQAPDSSRLPPGAVVQPLDREPGAEHRRNLTTLANNPRSVAALIGAGRSALALGDGQAALSFFARADEIEPRNPRVKAGMASAMVLLERGSAALALFREAEALGAPAVEIASDRGLAYDMTGDPRRAQQDYALVLRRGDDDEVRRRMALSLAISGRREEALAMIEPQLRRQDRAAWRTQAFVLALTGDATGANQTAARMLPGGGQSLAPFFARLASLSPAQKALAVHFGSFPSDGRAMASANVDTSPDPGAIALARNDMPAEVRRPRPVVRQPLAEPATAQRRRPDTVRETRERRSSSRPSSGWELAGRIAPPARRPGRSEPATRRFEPARPEPEAEPPKPEPSQAEPEPVAQSEYRPLPPTEPAATPAAGDGQQIQLADGSTLVEPGFSLTPGSSEPADEPASPPPAETASAPAPAEPGVSTGLGDLGSVLQGISDEEAPAPAPQRAPPRVEPRQTRTAEARTTPPRPAARRPAQPSRRWVQIATVPDRAALAREFSRLRSRAPEALRNRSAYMAPFGRSSSRLLVGPFETARAAQELVTQLGRANVSAFAWTSEAGQEIDRVQTANDSRTARNRAEPAERPAARGARGRSQPEPRSPARGRRTR
jgi:Flp pilus assembly protein TadD